MLHRVSLIVFFVPLFSMYLVSCLAWSTGTPWISTRTRGSTMESSLMLTLGSCWPLITFITCSKHIHSVLSVKVSQNDFCPCGLYLDSEDDGLVVVLCLRHLRIKPLVCVSHEAGLQDVAAAAVLTEQPVVQIHAFTCCLEVQRN